VIKAVYMARYKGYLIFGKALKVYPDSLYWGSQGSIFTNTPEGCILIKRVGGAIFESQRAAEAHGLIRCKRWIDKNLNTIEEGKR
jgi:hypothetical protein